MKYNKNNKIIKRTYLDKKGKEGNIYRIFYNKKNQKMKKKKINNSGKLVRNTNYEYDEEGNMVAFRRKKEGKVIKEYEYKYNDQDKMIKRKWSYLKDGEMKIRQIRKYKYDKYGNKILEIHKNNKGIILEKTKKRFFAKDKLKWKKTIARWEDGLLKVKYEEKYNKRGDLIKEVEVGGDVNGVETLVNKKYQYKYKKIKVKKKGE